MLGHPRANGAAVADAGDAVAVADLEREPLGAEDDDACVLAEGERETVRVALALVDTLALNDVEPDAVPESDGVADAGDAVVDGVVPTDSVGDTLLVALSDGEGVAVGVVACGAMGTHT